jgi:16S rRNA (uracil1498-N3)-methyltransferase
LLIGPEGDFSAGEYEGILEAGFAPVSLGNLVLRTETAVFWMIAAVRYQFQS